MPKPSRGGTRSGRTGWRRKASPSMVLESSYAVTLMDEYPDLAPVGAVARATLMIEEYFRRLHEAGVRLPFTRRNGMILLHGYCHQKAMVSTQPSLPALRWIPGATAREVDSGWRGIAESFGYETEHYETSLAMGERVRFEAIHDLPPDAVGVASGASCCQQIFHGNGRRGLHLVEVLADALEDAPRGSCSREAHNISD